MIPLLNIDYSKIPELPELKWNIIPKKKYNTTFLQDLKDYYKSDEIEDDNRYDALEDKSFYEKQLDRFPCNNVFKYLFGTYFIDYIFIDKIQEEIQYYCKLNDNITIYSKDETFDSLEVVWYLFNLINQISKIKVNKNHQIHLVPIDIEKKLRNDGKFTYNNINSGVCFNHNTIVIWRKEEISKVLCHEMVHMLKMDYIKDTRHINNLAEKLFLINKQSETIVNEATTECLTVYIISHLNSYFIKNKTVDENHIRKLLEFEMKWTCKQMKKIWKYLISHDISFETDIISYFFIKGLLLFRLLNYDDLHQYLFHQIEQFSNTELNSKMIRQYILNLDFLDNFGKYFSKVEEDNTDSLRMTYCSK
jgi:hypothetical protein